MWGDVYKWLYAFGGDVIAPDLSIWESLISECISLSHCWLYLSRQYIWHITTMNRYRKNVHLFCESHHCPQRFLLSPAKLHTASEQDGFKFLRYVTQNLPSKPTSSPTLLPSCNFTFGSAVLVLLMFLKLMLCMFVCFMNYTLVFFCIEFVVFLRLLRFVWFILCVCFLCFRVSRAACVSVTFVVCIYDY